MRAWRPATIPALALALIGAVTPVPSASPTDQLRQSIDRVLAVLNDPAMKGPRPATEGDAVLRRVIETRFDVDETARESLGPAWRRRTPAERRQFTALFKSLLERTYLARIAPFADHRVKYVGERVDGDRATVQTRMVSPRGEQIAVDYRLLRRGDQWLVYDVLVEGVSLVDNYRTQFQDIIARSSYRALVDGRRS